jgi:general secretion pathway protein B
LPQNVRDDMPDLHISVLVYAERPEDRFVLINGQRVVEREVVDHGVVLEEIRRNGAVFQYRTYRFMVEG